MRIRALGCGVVLTLIVAVAPARGETRAATFPTAFRPHGLNTIVASKTAPVAFVGSRDTDTVFAFDPRTGEGVGQVEVADGPLALEMLETEGRRLLAITCDGFLGAAGSVIAIVDATDPARMRLDRVIALPAGQIFFLGSKTLRFLDASTLLVTGTNDETARGTLFAFDVATGAERSHADVGFAPASVELGAADGRRIALVSQSVAPRGRVTVVDVTDPAAMTVARTVKFPRKSGLYNVNNVAVGRDGRTCFIATGDGNAFFAFDAPTGRVLSRTVTGSFPTFVRTFEIDGAPRLLVVAENAAAAAVYDVSDPEHPALTASFQSTAVFLDVEPALSSDGRTAFFGTTAGDRAFAVDIVTGALRYQTPTGQRPVASAVWEGGGDRYVCFAASASTEVTTFEDDPAAFVGHRFAGAADAVYFTLYQNVVLSRDARFAFVASQRTDDLLVIDVESAAIVGRVAVCDAPSQIAIAEEPDSGRRRVAVLGIADSTLSIVDATDPHAPVVSGSVDLQSPYPFFLEFANIAVTADGQTAFVADGNQFVHAVDLASAEIVGSIGAGFVPVTVAIHEDRGQRRLAVLNVMQGASSVAILDVSSPSQMARVATAELPEDVIVALNNVPRFSIDGRFVIVGASLSDAIYSIDAATGRFAGKPVKASAVAPAVYADAGLQRFAAVNLASDPTRLYRLRSSGAARETATIDALEGGFFLVGNDPVVASDGAWGVVPNFGRSSLIAFDPRNGVVTGELPLGKGPGIIAVDPATGTVAAIEVNGTSSRLLVANLGDVAPLARSVAPAPTGVARRGGATGAVAPYAPRADAPRVATYSSTAKGNRVWERLSSPK